MKAETRSRSDRGSNDVFWVWLVKGVREEGEVRGC